MIEEELKARGFPGGDAELLKEFRRLMGRDPAYIVSEPNWVRSLMFDDVMTEPKREAAGIAEQPPYHDWQAPIEPHSPWPRR